MVVYSCHQFFWVGSQIAWTYADCFVFKSSCSLSCSCHAITSSVLTIANRCQLRRQFIARFANQHASKSGPIFHLIFEPQNWFRHASSVKCAAGARVEDGQMDFWQDMILISWRRLSSSWSRATSRFPSICDSSLAASAGGDKQSAWQHPGNATPSLASALMPHCLAYIFFLRREEWS